MKQGSQLFGASGEEATRHIQALSPGWREGQGRLSLTPVAGSLCDLRAGSAGRTQSTGASLSGLIVTPGPESALLVGGCQSGGVKGGPAPSPDPPAPYQGLGRASPSQRGLCSPGPRTPAAGSSVAMETLETLLVLSALLLLPAEAQQGRGPTLGGEGSWG